MTGHNVVLRDCFGIDNHAVRESLITERFRIRMTNAESIIVVALYAIDGKIDYAALPETRQPGWAILQPSLDVTFEGIGAAKAAG